MIHSELLTTFVAFARHASFTRAAEELHVSQPAVHAQVKRLAEELGVPLYRRVGRGLVLTEEGRKLLAFGREQEERATSLLRELGRPAPAGAVVVAAGEGALRHVLGDGLRAFVASGVAPLRVLTRDAPGTIAALESGEAHVGVAVVDSVPDGLYAQPLVTAGTVVAMPRGHALARKRTLRLRDLDGEGLIVPPPGRPFRVTTAAAFEAKGIRLVPAVEARGWDLALHFATLGLGLALVHDFCAIPRGLVSRPLRELPRVTYRVLRRQRTLRDGEPLAVLVDRLVRGRR